MDATVVPNAAALDADIKAAMNAQMTFSALYLKWVQPRQGADREKMSRYIAERVHDVFVGWGH